MDGLERRSISVLKIGFPDFPALAEELEVATVGARLGELLDALSDPVLRLDGTVLMYDQAVLLAVWGAPHPLPDHARLALQAAEAAMRAAVSAAKGSSLKVRGGLATGESIVGLGGSRIRKTFGVFGKLGEDADRFYWEAGPNRLAVSARTWLEARRPPYAGNPDPLYLAF